MTEAVVCDFCHADEPTWDYPARNFVFPAIVPGAERQHSTGSWLACDVCHTLIEADRWRDLARRSAVLFMQRHNIPLFPQTRSDFLTHAVQAHRLFKEHRAGPPTRRA